MEIITYTNSFISAINFISLLAVITNSEATSDTKVVVASAPVHPVKEGAILSVHCQINSLAANNYVTISRQLDGEESPQILTWGETVLGNIGDNVFLAIRQLNDGSIIYFLSIVGVTIRDQGKYICKVMPSTQDFVVGWDSTFIKIQYFPRDPHPNCTPKTQGLTVYSGTPITLKCTSQTAFPEVALTWRKGADRVPESNVRSMKHNGTSYTELRFRASLSDNEAVFLCQLTSPAFPNKVKSCHVGPITVLPNPNDPSNPGKPGDRPLPTVRLPPLFYPTKDPTSINLYTDSNIERDVADCKEVCSSFSSPRFFWIAATVVACALAFIFFIMGASLLWKYRQAHAQQQTYYATSAKPFPAHPREYIYTELDSKRGIPNTENIGSCVYMSLERRENHDNQTDLARVKSTKE